jgi:hypothetical protein
MHAQKISLPCGAGFDAVRNCVIASVTIMALSSVMAGRSPGHPRL